MKNIQPKQARGLFLALMILLLLAGCGGGGGSDLADGGIIGTGSIVGTVPGTIIEAFGDQGQYFQVTSVDDNTDQHPFYLELPAGIGFHLVMIINEGTADEIVIPIAFEGADQKLLSRIILTLGDEVDLGHIPLYSNRDEIPDTSDPDEDGILDEPFILDENDANNPLLQLDSDDDGVDDYDDDDHGDPSGKHDDDPQDHDNDGIPNKYDNHFSPGPNDEDEDGIDDDDDENPGNNPEDNDDSLYWNGKGMHPAGMAWREQHGDYAEHNIYNCASCHGDDFRGTPLSAQVGCYDCHDGPDLEDEEDEEDSQSEWNGQGMHPAGMAWREQHGDYAEHNLDNCASCHGDDFRGTPLSDQVGCYDCHDGPDPEDEEDEEDKD